VLGLRERAREEVEEVEEARVLHKKPMAIRVMEVMEAREAMAVKVEVM
jgi:hypothetical protein